MNSSRWASLKKTELHRHLDCSIRPSTLRELLTAAGEPVPASPADHPSMLDVLTTSLNIMQVRITHSRLAGEPADAMIRPRLSHIAAMDFHRAEAAIAEGERAAEAVLPLIRDLLN